MVPAEPDAERHQVGPARQREHAGERDPHHDEQRREEPRDVPRELLPEEQAHHRARPDQGAVRLRGSGGAAAPGRSRRADEPDPPRRRRGAHRERRVHRRQRRRSPPGDYIVRLDQPYGAIVETLLGVQFYPPENPRPYDDTGWAIPLLRNVKATAVADKAILTQPMTLAAGRLQRAPARSSGTGPVLIVDHTTDNTLVTFRFQHAGVKMSAAEQAFEAGGHKFAAGAFVIANADRAALEPSIKALGPVGLGGRGRAVGADARPRRAEASATSTPGPARRTRAGSAWRSTSSRCPTPTSPTTWCARAT